jgi:anti-anti-sigma factor
MRPGTLATGELVIATELDAGSVVVSLCGELDLACTARLEHELVQVQSAARGRLLIDLSQLSFIDSEGLKTLLLARKQAIASGNELCLRRGPDAVQRVFELTRTVHCFSFLD